MGRLFGNRVSVKLCRWLEIGNHGNGASRRSMDLGDVNVEENGVVVEDREIRVLDNGRIRVLRIPIPNPISLFSELSTATTVNCKQ